MKNIMIVDNRYASVAEKVWGDEFIVVPSVTCTSLSEPVSAHPDMTLFPVCEKTFVCAPEVFGEYEKKLSPFGIKLICGETTLKSNYPKDIAYNIFKTEKFALGKFASTDNVILNLLNKSGIEMTEVKQGYSKCSVCGFGSCAITADNGLFDALKDKGMNVLKVPCGEIVLEGYDYGFIGGASGERKNGEVFFFGDLESITYGGKIRDFVLENGWRVREIKGYPLTDTGTIFFC